DHKLESYLARVRRCSILSNNRQASSIQLSQHRTFNPGDLATVNGAQGWGKANRK
ncbi:hypothetical protein ACLOJK_019743, partial [Asimina triloba]